MRRTSHPQGITVEARLESGLDRVWALTQQPSQHSRWDARFGRIEPTADGRFRYRRFGVAGSGEHSGDRHGADGSATSALRFACENPLSPIEEGSGYWQYRPHSTGGLTFATWYDYRSRYPRIDRVFRPVMAWGTAWSFDRLRLWADRGLPPEVTASVAVLDTVARTAVVAAAARTIGGPRGLAAAALMSVLAVRFPALPWAPAARRTTWSAGSTR